MLNTLNVYYLLCLFEKIPVHVISPFLVRLGFLGFFCSFVGFFFICFTLLFAGSVLNFCSSLKTILGILQASSGSQLHFIA